MEIKNMHPEYKILQHEGFNGTHYKLTWKDKVVNGIAIKGIKDHVKQIIEPMIAAMDNARIYGLDNSQ